MHGIVRWTIMGAIAVQSLSANKPLLPCIAISQVRTEYLLKKITEARPDL